MATVTNIIFAAQPLGVLASPAASKSPLSLTKCQELVAVRLRDERRIIEELSYILRE